MGVTVILGLFSASLENNFWSSNPVFLLIFRNCQMIFLWNSYDSEASLWGMEDIPLGFTFKFKQDTGKEDSVF